jgi:hypothetical protein
MVSQFCLAEGVSVPSFYHWRKQLLPLPADASAAAGRFQPVQIVSSFATSGRQATIIRWGRGLEIELGNNLAVVEAVVKQLLETAGCPTRPEWLWWALTELSWSSSWSPGEGGERIGWPIGQLVRP